ncbi:MAG: hypothetical protein SGCHY_005375 [Lobulomycetales sp.]
MLSEGPPEPNRTSQSAERRKRKRIAQRNRRRLKTKAPEGSGSENVQNVGLAIPFPRAQLDLELEASLPVSLYAASEGDNALSFTHTILLALIDRLRAGEADLSRQKPTSASSASESGHKPAAFSSSGSSSGPSELGDEKTARLLAQNRAQLAQLQFLYQEKDFSQSETLAYQSSCEELTKRVDFLGKQVGGLEARLELREREYTEMRKTLTQRNEALAKELARVTNESIKQESRLTRLLDSLSLAAGKISLTDPFQIAHERWQDDASASTCTLSGCTVEFGIINRRHHCRLCGQIFCASHSRNRMGVSLVTYSRDDSAAKVRVCDDCFQSAADIEES